MNTERQQNLCLFTGFDIEQTGIEILHDSYRNGYSLLPKDADGIRYAQQAGLPFIFIDEYVGFENLILARKEAIFLEKNWYQLFTDHLSNRGICMPKADEDALSWFWRDFILTEYFVRIFRKNGGKKIRCFSNDVFRPFIFCYPSDIVTEYLQKLLGHDSEVYRYSDQKDIGAYLCDLRIRFDLPLSHDITGKIVFALNPGEFLRFNGIIQDTMARFPGQVALFSIFPISDTNLKKYDYLPLPVIRPLKNPQVDTQYQQQFMKIFRLLLDQEILCDRTNPLQIVPRQFEPFFMRRWPNLASNYEVWSDLWKVYQPKTVIVSALSDAESQLPALAAQRLSIPTIALPHGAMGSGKIKNECDYSLYTSELQKRIQIHKGHHPCELIGCRDAIEKNEHPAEVRNVFANTPKLRILALTNPVFKGECFTPFNQPSRQVRAIKILNKIPSDLESGVSLKIKVNPKYSEIGIIEAAGQGVSERIIEPSTELENAVKEADIVVSVNYFGSAILHVFGLNKPVIFLRTDQLEHTVHRLDPGATCYIDILHELGPVAESGRQFWDIIRKFITDAEFRNSLDQHVRNAHQKYCEDAEYPSLAEIISNVQSKQRPDDSQTLPSEKTEMQMQFSVIIPTLNRAEVLRSCLDSLMQLRFPVHLYEIIVVDNGSTDHTKQVIDSYIRRFPDRNIRNIYESQPGLLAGRQRGAKEARAEYLSYLDDDVLVHPEWLQGMQEVIQQTQAVLVGGKILPKYEIQPPEWIKEFLRPVGDFGYHLGLLGLIDLGDQIREIDPGFVWGGNSAIRKDVLFECGGFHPDYMPNDFIEYIGDGETGLYREMKRKGYKAYYSPKACIWHCIPKERLTVEYFCKRMFYQGMMDSFTEIRDAQGIKNPIQTISKDAYQKGKMFHREKVLENPALIEWILKKDYFDIPADFFDQKGEFVANGV